MNEVSRRFRVGAIDAIVISDGTFTYPSAVFAANVPVARVDAALRAHALPAHEVVSPYLCLLLKTAQHCVLVDTGAGFAPTNGQLHANLAAEGITPQEIDTVILTHGHADHIGGATDAQGQPAFPNARYVMWESEWAFWTQERPDLAAMPVAAPLKDLLIQFAQAKLPPLRAQLDVLTRAREIVPGIAALPAPGHTPGHMALVIASEGQQVLHLADTVLHRILIEHPDWTPGVDLLADQAIATRRRLLDQAATDRMPVFAFHFPFPGLGSVTAQGGGWVWQPLETATTATTVTTVTTAADIAATGAGPRSGGEATPTATRLASRERSSP